MKKNGLWASLITLTDPSLMRSVPLQLEKILDAVCQPMVWGDRRGGRVTHPRALRKSKCKDVDGSRKDAFKADPSWSDARRKK